MSQSTKREIVFASFDLRSNQLSIWIRGEFDLDGELKTIMNTQAAALLPSELQSGLIDSCRSVLGGDVADILTEKLGGLVTLASGTS